jgi:hypothetical protein
VFHCLQSGEFPIRPHPVPASVFAPTEEDVIVERIRRYRKAELRRAMTPERGRAPLPAVGFRLTPSTPSREYFDGEPEGPADAWWPNRATPSGLHPGDWRPGTVDWEASSCDMEEPLERGWAGNLQWVRDAYAARWRAQDEQPRPRLILDSEGLSRGSCLPEEGGGPLPVRNRARVMGRYDAERKKAMRRKVTPDEMSRREVANRDHMEDRAGWCGTRSAIVERRLPAAGVEIERAVVPLACGTRRCEACFTRIRSHAGQRLRGPWTQFLTLTTPHVKGRRLHHWRRASEWATKFFTRLRDIARKGQRRCVCRRSESDPDHVEMRIDGEKFHYAWVVEPHQTGWPHWHCVHNAAFLCDNFVRTVWASVTGSEMVLTKRKQVHTRNGVCRYLVKYLTKAVYSDDILAILYRKRLWASTMPAEETWSLGYEVVGFAKTENIAAVYEGRHVPHRSDDDAPMVLDRAWELVQLCKGKFARWRISCGVEDIERKIFDDEERERFREWWERRWARARVGPEKNVRTAAGPKVLMGRSTGNATRIDRDAARRRSMVRIRKDIQQVDVLAQSRGRSDEVREESGG